MEKQYKIFGNGGSGIEAIKKLQLTPYGKQIIGTQIQQEIRNRLGISLEDKNDVTAQIRFNGVSETGEDVFMIWTDGERSSKTEEEVNKAIDEVEKELTAMGYPQQHFYVTYIPKDGVSNEGMHT